MRAYIEVPLSGALFLLTWFVVSLFYLIHLAWTRKAARHALRMACSIIRNEAMCKALHHPDTAKTWHRWARECAEEGMLKP